MLRPSPNHGTQRLPNDDDDDEYQSLKAKGHIVEWFVNILYTGLCPPRDTSLEVFSPPLLPCPPCSLPSSLNPSSARSLPPIFPARCPCLVPSLHQPTLPQTSLPPLTLSPCLASSLPPSPRSRSPPPILTLLPPSHPPIIPCSFPPPPCLHACRRPKQCTQCVLFGQLHWAYCVASSQAWQ